jgi:hypothetical protein
LLKKFEDSAKLNMETLLTQVSVDPEDEELKT